MQIIPLLMSAMKTSDRSESIFFIARSICSIAGLKDLCRVLKIIYSVLHGRLSVLPANTGYDRL